MFPCVVVVEWKIILKEELLSEGLTIANKTCSSISTSKMCVFDTSIKKVIFLKKNNETPIGVLEKTQS